MQKQKNSRKGFFITLEGPEGSGKTTVVKKLQQYFSITYPGKVVLTREPGGTNNLIAEDIRNILLNNIDYKITPLTETLLFAASRAQHINDFIMPNLDKNNIVICDRYVHSSLAYQGVAREVGIDKVKQINDCVTNGCMPDLTLFLMLEPQEGLNRINKNSNREKNRLDRETIELHYKVFEGYKKILKQYPKNIKVIDASKSEDEIFDDIKKCIHEKLLEKGYDGK